MSSLETVILGFAVPRTRQLNRHACKTSPRSSTLCFQRTLRTYSFTDAENGAGLKEYTPVLTRLRLASALQALAANLYTQS